MKNIIIIISLLVGCSATRAQNLGSPISDDHVLLPKDGDYGYFYDDSVWYSILFFEKEMVYLIEVTEQVTDDQLETSLISSGTFKREGNNVQFFDTSTFLKMKARIEDDSLRFVNGYKLLMNKKFIPLPTQWLYTEFYGTFPNGDLMVRSRNSLYRDDYPAIVPGDWYRLHLDSDKTFTYCVRWHVPILAGTWSQKGNLIILHDEHTDHDFYLIYEEPNLRTMLLPGDWNIEGTVLTPQ